MIHFDLRCRSCGHGFDGWFRSSEDFDRQISARLVACPLCQAEDVEKALMRPAIAKGGAAHRDAPREAADGPAGAPAGAAGSAGAPVAPTTLANVPAPHPEIAKAFAVLQEISRKVRAEADYVGGKFADEARRIHYGESDARQIYGEASHKEVESLAEEGITAVPLMPLPEDKQ
ncbi:DUF1178 family protein [Jiella sp. MQZ9-1]|uniref:DUF1178 family protein n=1 Tax=Jiella flava TaxID=2816857 RepID=A0A939FV23_9HYPH|nr:DUF1178 family protein [Jiella flava]MBO0661965.1 DUF1178 family protein [Jiella flava]MCD2470708.1 DUF1178 family protein [Jiella flava]